MMSSPPSKSYQVMMDSMKIEAKIHFFLLFLVWISTGFAAFATLWNPHAKDLFAVPFLTLMGDLLFIVWCIAFR